MWTATAPVDLPDNGEAFILIGNNALHVRHVHLVDGKVEARVVHAWLLPPAGAAALCDDPDSSPEDIAHRAGWPELHIVNTRLDVPRSVIRSARTVVDVVPDPSDDFESGHPIFTAVVTSALEIVLEPCLRCSK